MFKPFSKSITNALLIFGIIISMTACSGSSNASPTAAPTIPPTSAPVEQPIEASTPTSSFTFLPTETVAEIPEITPTPSYDWCKSVNTRSATIDEVKMNPAPDDEAFGAFSCLLEVVGTNITDYVTQAIIVKIGFVDNAGVVHPYQAIIGGLIYKNSQVEDFKYPKCASQNPEYYTLDEFTAHLQTFINPAEPKEFPLLIIAKAGLKYHWPPEASPINLFAETNLLIKNALENGNGYPQAPEDHQMFILPGLQACQ